jgi:glycosyltransferase involved in cell wall biosynthesis
MNRGGPSRCVINLACRLQAEGFSTLVATGTPDPGEGDMSGELTARGGQCITVPGLQRGLNPVKDLAAYQALKRLVRTFRPHIIHTHTAKAGLLGRRAARSLTPRPVRVHTFHGHVLDSYFGPLRSGLYRHLERRWAQDTDALIAVAPSVRDELLAEHRVGKRDQYRIIPSGLPELDMQGAGSLRDELGLGEAFVIGFVGRLVPIKGVEEFLEAVPLISAKHPGVKFLVVGDGPLHERARALAETAPYRKALHLVGLRTDRERIFKTLDLLMLPSRKEGLPTVLLEAALAGVPAAASMIPGVCDLFDHEREALLFKPRSAPAMAEAAVRLVEDSSLCEQLAARAREKVLNTVPDYGEVARRHARLYRSLLQEAQQRAAASAIH